MANRIIVSQIGSRHRYLVPQILYDAGILHKLYTDSNSYSLLGKLSKLFINIGFKVNLLQRLSNRNPKIPKNKVFSSDIISLKKIFNFTYQNNGVNRLRLYYDGLSNAFIQKGTNHADCIYSMFIENISFLEYAKSQGLKIVIDIYESPIAFRELYKEMTSNPDLSHFSRIAKNYRDKSIIREELMERILAVADYYTVPSHFVEKSLAEYANYDKNKTIILPYGASITAKSYSYNPVRHRLIWVGNDPIRKGLYYCAKAATLLKKKYKDLDFRIIGVVEPEIIKSEIFKDLHFIGVLNKQDLQREYCSAEAYVFPTLYEGFAGTIIEAASCGCPIITTECAGTNREAFPALYINPRSTQEIVDKVEMIFEDERLKYNLSSQVYEYSKTLTPEIYKIRLIKTLLNI